MSQSTALTEAQQQALANAEYANTKQGQACKAFAADVKQRIEKDNK